MKDIFDLIILIIIFIVNVFIFLSFLGFFWGASKGAPFVPSKRKTVEKMVELANIQPGDNVYDLGSGDGRLVFMAADQGANAIGIEISPLVHWWALLRKKVGEKKGILRKGSLWDVDLSHADIIFTYLLPQMMARFEREKFPTLKKGCRLITHGFAMKNTQPKTIWKPENSKTGKILIYEK